MKYSVNNPRPLPQLCELHRILAYCPDTGRLSWKINIRGGVKAGDEAGHLHSSGYRQVRINGHIYRAHRIAWAMFHNEEPPTEIDHIDTDPLNCAIVNLRPCTSSANKHNSNMRSDNSSGVTGVSWYPSREKWEVYAWLSGKKHRGGYFSDISDAISRVCEMTEQLHGSEFGRINVREDLRHHVPERYRYLLRLENQL